MIIPSHDECSPSTHLLSSIDIVIVAWIDEKMKLSHSEKTKKAYTETLFSFRQWLQRQGLDLDSQGEENLTAIALIAQAFAGSSTRGKSVSASTYNTRLAILSSFYEYAKGKRLVVANPIDGVQRGKVDAYGGSRSLEQENVRVGLSGIDTETLQGKRDKALLALFLQTGRRLQEVANLQLCHLTLSQGKITVTFARCKGNKEMRDTLPLEVSSILLEWIHAYYEGKVMLGMSNDTRPLWVSLAHGSRDGKKYYGVPLGPQSIADICKKYLGTSKVHAMRHTYAHLMEKAGATVSDIQSRLGHESLVTTGRYLAKLKQDENVHGDALASMLGLKETVSGS
jgi:integrase/recombinase XerD